MNDQHVLRGIALRMGLVFCTAAAVVPAFAAPMFGAASTTVSNCGPAEASITGELNSVPVNSGAGVVLSGSASSTGTGGFCLNLEWSGPLTGSIDPTNSVPILFDYTVDFTGAMPTLVQSTLYVEISHEPYVTGGFNQGGFSYSANSDGTGRFMSAPALSLEWLGPADGAPRAFRGYYASLLVVAATESSSIETLSVNVPAATSIDLGVVRATSVPAPEVGMLMGVGLLAASAVRRRSSRQVAARGTGATSS